MEFIIFITLFFAITLFHRQEHLWFIEELHWLQRKLANRLPDDAGVKQGLKNEDWRLVALNGTKAGLRRAFNPADKKAMARYFAPVLFLAALMLVLQSWSCVAVYAAALAVKWFVTVTELDLSPQNPWYEVKLAGRKLFGESLSGEKLK